MSLREVVKNWSCN